VNGGFKSEIFECVYSGVNVTNCCPNGVGFDSGVMHGCFPHVKEGEDTGLRNQKSIKYTFGLKFGVNHSQKAI
jgi:hypothetical protein